MNDNKIITAGRSMEPGLGQKAKSFGNSLKSWVKSGFTQTSEEDLNKRLEICKACEFWDPEGFKATGKCKKCGCSTWGKLRMATERCPIGKWESVKDFENTAQIEETSQIEKASHSSSSINLLSVIKKNKVISPFESKPVTIIVTGTVRSGTSAVTQMLHESGIKVLFDDARKADSNNPNGYFEYSNLARDFFITRRQINQSNIMPTYPQWLDNIYGGAVKILPNNFIENLPLDRVFAVIFMERDKKETANSYWKLVNTSSFLERFKNTTLAKELEKSSKEEYLTRLESFFEKKCNSVLKYMESLPLNFKILKINFANLVNPDTQEAEVIKINNFVNENLKSEFKLIMPKKGN